MKENRRRKKSRKKLKTEENGRKKTKWSTRVKEGLGRKSVKDKIGNA
jgi:hypothetical protein